MGFTLDGRPVKSGDFGKAIMKSLTAAVAQELRERISAIRHPKTGEFPTVLVQGDRFEDMSLRVEGSPELLALVQQRLNQDERDMVSLVTTDPAAPPKAFLSYAGENRVLAKQIAEFLQVNGIETWWAEWEIGAGDSLRQRIDAGLQDCTHFIVLLTPISIGKPWVNQEMDAGLVRKISGKAHFICLRHQLPAAQLPLLLSGQLSPEIGSDFEADMRQLVNDIHGVSRKPPLGPKPAAATSPQTGYSSAATAVAKHMVEESEHAVFSDPDKSYDQLAAATGLSKEDVVDALHELRPMVDSQRSCVWPKPELFAAFDGYFKDWQPADDALRLAADLVNDAAFPKDPAAIAKRYGWPPRRLNPAIAYLQNRQIIRADTGIGVQSWVAFSVTPTDETRRFVKSRS